MPEFTSIEKANRRLHQLKLERDSFVAHYKELSKFIQPRKGRFYTSDRNVGGDRWNNIINSHATWAHRVARAGLLAGLTSPARPWFITEPFDTDMAEFQPVKIWNAQVTHLIRTILNDSNFYNMVPTMFGELLLFATGAMIHVDDFQDVARFYTQTAGSYVISQNDRLIVDTFGREYEMTVEQLIGKFGLENVSDTVKNFYDRGNYYAWIPVSHLIYPNKEFDQRRKRNTFKRFRSLYWEQGKNSLEKVLSDSGFDEFPVHVPRWDLTGEDIYGTDCPAMQALGDVKQMQVEERRKAQGIDKMVNPPLHGPASLARANVVSLPGGLTTYDAGGTNHKLESIYDVNLRLSELVEDIREVQHRIERAFYVDLFLTIINMEGIQPRNQLELLQRNEERLLQIGPVIERFHGEFATPLIERIFNQALKAGILPPPPRELMGQPLRIRFISALAMAQRAVATGTIERTVNFVGGLASIGYMHALKKFDALQAVDEYANAVGAPPRVIVPDDVVEQQIAAEQQVMEQQRAMEMMNSGADTANKLANSPMTEDNVLNRVSEKVANG